MVAIVLIATSAGAQADPEALGRQAVERLAEAVDDRRPDGVQDALRDLDAAWEQLSPKTAARALKAVSRLFERYAPRDEIRADGTTDRDDVLRCYRMAAGLVFDRDGGDKVLRAALGRAHVREWPEAVAVLLEGLGHRRDPALLDLLADHLQHEEARVVVAAAEALGRLSEADHAARAAAAEHLIATWAALAERAGKAARRDPEAPEVALLRRAEFPLGDALAGLTRRRFDDPAAWERWWREEGRGGDW